MTGVFCFRSNFRPITRSETLAMQAICMYDTVGGIPKCTVPRIVSRVSTALAWKQHQFIRWPSTAAERQEIKQGFFEKGGFPGVIGCIDGTHIRIQGPSAHESDFVNGKGFHAINDQAPFDHKGKYPGLLNCWHLLNETYFLIAFEIQERNP